MYAYFLSPIYLLKPYSSQCTINYGETMAEGQPQKLNIKVGDHVIREDLSSDNYAVVSGGTTVYVRKAYADVASYVAQAGEGFAYVKPASPGQVLGYQYNVALYTRFIGTSGYMAGATVIGGQRTLERYQYVRPISQQAPALLSVVGLARALTNSGLPWSAVVVAYIDNRPRVLYVKSIYAWYQRYHTSAGIKAIPEVRFIFTRHLIHGLRKKSQYYFDLIVFYKVPTARATVARAKPYVRAVGGAQPAPKAPTKPQPPAPQPQSGGSYVQAVADQYVQQADQEQTIAELRAKEQELEEEARQLSINGNVKEAIEKHKQLLRIRQEIEKAMRHSTA